MEKSNRQIDVTGDVIHALAIRYNTTLREINSLVGDRIYEIIGDCERNFNREGQMDLFDK